MDPNEAMKQLRDWLQANPDSPFRDVLSGLLDWISAGGFKPTGRPKIQITFEAPSEYELKDVVTRWLLPEDSDSYLLGPKADKAEVGTDLITQDHYKTIKSGVNDVIGAMLTGEVDDEDKLQARIQEYADSATTYLVTQFQILLASKNYDAAVDQGMAVSNRDGVYWQMLASLALQEDIKEALKLEEVEEHETGDPLELYAVHSEEEEEVENEEAQEGGEEAENEEAENEETREVIVVTLSYDNLDLEGRGDDLETALAALRADYQARRK